MGDRNSLLCHLDFQGQGFTYRWMWQTKNPVRIHTHTHTHKLRRSFAAYCLHVSAISCVLNVWDGGVLLARRQMLKLIVTHNDIHKISPLAIQKIRQTLQWSWSARRYWLSHRWTPATEIHTKPRGAWSNTPIPYCYPPPPRLYTQTHTCSRHKNRVRGCWLNTNVGPIYISSRTTVSTSLFQGESGELPRTHSSRLDLSFTPTFKPTT